MRDRVRCGRPNYKFGEIIFSSQVHIPLHFLRELFISRATIFSWGLVSVSSFLAPGIFYVMLNSKIQAYLMGTTDLSWYHYSPCFLRISLFSWVQLKTFGSLHRRYTRGSYSNFTSDIKVVVSPSNFMSSIQCVNFIIIVINYQFVVVWSFVVYTMKFWFSAPAITYYFKQAPPSLELNILFHFFRWISEIDAPLK